MKRHGAEITFSEMVSADGLLRSLDKQERYIEFAEAERPFAIQLFASEPGILAQGVEVVKARRPDIIDLNFACPVRKVVKRGAGAAILEDPDRALALVDAAIEAAEGIPLTVKCRLDAARGAGLSKLLPRFEAAGVAAVTLHPRTRREGYRGKADRDAFASLAAGTSLPMIYSGDIKSAAEVVEVYRQTGAAALMIGRAAIGNPWIFTAARAAMLGREYRFPEWGERLKEFTAFRDELLVLFGERKGVLEARKFIGYLLKGLSGARKYVQDFYRAGSPEEQDRVVSAFLASL